MYTYIVLLAELLIVMLATGFKIPAIDSSYLAERCAHDLATLGRARAEVSLSALSSRRCKACRTIRSSSFLSSYVDCVPLLSLVILTAMCVVLLDVYSCVVASKSSNRKFSACQVCECPCTDMHDRRFEPCNLRHTCTNARRSIDATPE